MTQRQKPKVIEVLLTKPETAMEKTTRIAMKMLDEEAEQRKAKSDRLRIARQERDANTSIEEARAERKARKTRAAPKR
ncbi:hypothetical protein C8N43_0654 [Litoreibacter ponti]|uniref:Uncharacterized protein n=1 Tax=Litoreibacter ponti TaxID=1510457 RepID=A0A2T6BIW9_9RHOB|nr:hypothetical protein [Litoreibacter ponti]PTX56005.1 hypothetical protein C8N43_0654 [Litoreibacter ponti]